MSQPPDKPEKGKSKSTTWTDGGPSGGGAQDKSFAYRQSRRAFIAACEKAGADVVSRVHPGRGPDGLPLFMDAAAFGPRTAKSGVLVVAYGAPGSGVLQALLAGKAPARLPPGSRLVLVHGADPAAFAWNDDSHSDPGWEAAMLAAVLAEDLRKVQRLAVVGLGGAPRIAAPAGVGLNQRVITPDGAAKAVVEAAIAAQV